MKHGLPAETHAKYLLNIR